MAIANENQPSGCVSEQWLITAMCGLRSTSIAVDLSGLELR
jgi:hypothetical protein